MNAMKRRSVALATGICSVILLAAPAGAVAQQASARSALEGIWSLVSIVSEAGGKKSEPAGPNPVGLFIFDRSGHYAIQIFRRDLPAIASGDRNRTTPDEDKAVNQGALAHFGTYKVDDKAGTFTIHPTGSSFANWTGKELRRRFEVTGDDLKIINPSSSKDPTATSYLLLKRAR